MRVTISTTIAALALIAATAGAQGQTHKSRCGWDDGIYICTSDIETSQSITSSVCASAGIDVACRTKTVDKPPPARAPEILCAPPYRMTARHGCQK